MEAEVLCDEVVVLKPFDKEKDCDYLFDLIGRYESKVPRDLYPLVLVRMKYGWIGYSNAGVKGGVIELAYNPESKLWMIHGYRDDEKLCSLKIHEDWSFHSANLVLKFFFENVGSVIFTMIGSGQVFTERLLKRLDFKNIGTSRTAYGDYILFCKTR